MQLREYQQKAVDGARQVISLGRKKVLVVSPTGSGKSIMVAEIFRLASLREKKCLFLVHRRNLVLQIKETLEKFGLVVGVIMSGVETNLNALVQVSTIQTFSRRLNLDELDQNKFFFPADIVVCDEAHRCCSKQYVDVLNLYEGKVIIGFTGTPARSDGKGLGEVFEEIVDVISVKELTEKEFLAPVKYYSSPSEIDLSDVKIQCGDYQAGQLGDKMSSKKLVGDVVQNWLKYGEGRKTIVFAVNVKHSHFLLDEFLANGIPAARLDAKSPDEERQEVFQQMESGKVLVLINVLLYVEGMDCPEISCVSFARPTKSLVLYRQGGGRGMRPKKDGGNLIFLDHGNVIHEHGLLDDEIIWSLDGKELAWTKPKKARKYKKPITCSACKLIFQGSVCPDCGTEVKSYGKDVETIDADLEEIDPKKKKMTMADKRRWWGMCKHYQKQKGYSDGWASHKYKSKTGVWPRGMDDVSPIAPDVEFMNRIKYEQIKYAKQRQKQKELEAQK